MASPSPLVRSSPGGSPDGDPQYREGMSDRADVVAAHRELVEASDAVRQLLVVEHLTPERVDAACARLARAYEQAEIADRTLLTV